MPPQLFTYTQYSEDPQLAGGMLGPTFDNSKTITRALMGEPPKSQREVEFWKETTGLSAWPDRRADVGFLGWSRRSSKTVNAARLAMHFATCYDYDGDLQPNEWATTPILAATQRQASQTFDIVVGIAQTSPMFRDLITRITSDTIELSTRCRITVRPANRKTIRSITAPFAICEECCHWDTGEDSADLDRDVIDALTPCLATMRGMLLLISSPYDPYSAAYKIWAEFKNGNDPSVVAFCAPSLTFNPTLDLKMIERAIKLDPAFARSEWLGQWRSKVSALFTREMVLSCVAAGVFQLPYGDGFAYRAFYDASGGVSDAATLAIAHANSDGKCIVDCLRVIPAPHSPQSAIEECARVLEEYKLRTVEGDKYSGTFCQTEFARLGVKYAFSEKSKSELYVDSISLMTSDRIQLLDNDELINEICSLERRVSRNTGRDQVDHPQRPNAHDDRANAVLAACVSVAKANNSAGIWEGFGEAFGDDDDEPRESAGCFRLKY
jgi:hypothetical protein